MGLITEEVEIKVNSNTLKHYLNLGYSIPIRKASQSHRHNKEFCYDFNSPIMVKVEDLPHGSNVKVECECDYCDGTVWVKYQKYIKVINSDNPKITCDKCRNKKASENQMRLYGVSHPMQRQDVKDKVVATNRKKFGVDYPTQSPDVREKIKNNVQQKYHVNNISELDWVKEKKEKTLYEHFGVLDYLHSEECKKKMCQNNLEKYGVEYTLQVKEFREKGKQSCMEKYGVEHPMQCKEIQQKAVDTYKNRYKDNDPRYSESAYKKRVNTFFENQTVSTSRQQRYLGYLYNMELNYPLKYWNVDMFDEDNNLYVEYDGSGHKMCVGFKDLTEEQFEERERKRFYSLKQHGYKMIRIISRKDWLPSDEILLQMLDDAKQYFKDYPNHSWFEFDIDNQIVRNAEHKDGIPYFYGELRKIKKTDLESA